MSKPTAPLPDWERVLSSAAHLQRILPDAVLVGGTAAALRAAHRFSRDAGHVLTDLRRRFDEALAELESVAGWSTARVARPVQILGSLDGIETGVRQQTRDEPLETTTLDHRGATLTVPTEAEIPRIKGVLIIRRNATRDYLDFAALATRMGDASAARALRSFDRLYPQDSGESPLAAAAGAAGKRPALRPGRYGPLRIQELGPTVARLEHLGSCLRARVGRRVRPRLRSGSAVTGRRMRQRP